MWMRCGVCVWMLGSDVEFTSVEGGFSPSANSCVITAGSMSIGHLNSFSQAYPHLLIHPRCSLTSTLSVRSGRISCGPVGESPCVIQN